MLYPITPPISIDELQAIDPATPEGLALLNDLVPMFQKWERDRDAWIAALTPPQHDPELEECERMMRAYVDPQAASRYLNGNLGTMARAAPRAAPPEAPTAPITSSAPSGPEPDDRCPTLPELKLMTISFFDNGKGQTRINPATNKRQNAKPQFMLNVQAYDVDPAGDDFNWRKPAWQRNVLLSRHSEMRSKLPKLNISDEYRQKLTGLRASVDYADEPATFFGLFWSTSQGRVHHEHQFVMLDIRHGLIEKGRLWLDRDTCVELKFATSTHRGAFGHPSLKGQCRWDPFDFKAKSWKTC
jgi:hypothetical protein